MKVWLAEWSINYCGTGESILTSVVANTKEEAYGFLLERYNDTRKSDWFLSEVNIDEAGVYDYDWVFS